IGNFEAFLYDEGILDAPTANNIKNQITENIESNLKKAFQEPEIESTIEHEIQDVYKTHFPKLNHPRDQTKNMRFVDAVSDGLKEAMRSYEYLVIMGQDVAEYGGVFKVTEGFVSEFSKKRVRNTPICESAIISAAMGLAIKDCKAVVEMQFA